MILMMICLGGCSNETVLSDDQIKEKIREIRSAASSTARISAIPMAWKASFPRK